MTNKEIEEKYTPEEIEAIFRYQEMKYTIEEADFHIEEFVDWHELSEEEAQELYGYAEEMAKDFLGKYAVCSISENLIWEHIVQLYYNEKVRKND